MKFQFLSRLVLCALCGFVSIASSRNPDRPIVVVHNAPQPCGPTYGTFQCPNQRYGGCISQAFLCNGRRDCLDGADELNCQNMDEVTEECRENSFRCESTRNCLPKQFICDGRRDCNDSSDERNCTDPALHYFLNKFYQKRHDVDLENLSFCELDQLKACRCNPAAYQFYCLKVGFRDLSSIPVNATLIDVSGNLLGSLTPALLRGFTQVRDLIMSSCQSTSIEDGAFDTLVELETLKLSGNNITTISSQTFGWLRRLEKIQLSYNPITHIDSGSFGRLNKLADLDLRNCKLQQLTSGMFANLTSLIILRLDANDISEIDEDTFDGLRKLQMLTLTRNSLSVLQAEWFRPLEQLTQLDIGSNRLTQMDIRLILPRLEMLNADKNKIVYISEDAFSSTSYVTSLNMKGNPLTEVNATCFRYLARLRNVYFDEFSMCQWVPQAHVCTPRGDGISSLAHLLDNVILRISVWLVAIVACFGNLLVLIGRMLFREPNRVHSFYIKNLALSDLLMGAYLLIIAAHDVLFRGEYIRHDFRWRNSIKCSIAGALATISSEASVFTLTVITMDRFLSIKYPLSTKKRTVSAAWAFMSVAWIIAVLIAVFPIFYYGNYNETFYGTNGVCLPLHLHRPFMTGWRYSAFIFLAVNSAAFIFISYAYVVMFSSITDSRLNLRSTQQLQDRAIAKRFAFIVATDFLCWMPIAIIKIVAIATDGINDTLYAWVAIFLLPVNSALNPVLYTLTTRLFKQQLSRYLWSLKPLQFRVRRNSKKTLVTTLSDQQPGHVGAGGRLASIKLNGHSVKHAHLQHIDRDQLNQKLREQFV